MSEPMTSEALEELVREHAALRRVATLVARQPPSSAVFAGSDAGERLDEVRFPRVGRAGSPRRLAAFC